MLLISSYGAPLAQRASYLALHSSLFGLDGPVNYDYIITNSINWLLIGSRCIANGTHINHCLANLAHASKRIKNWQETLQSKEWETNDDISAIGRYLVSDVRKPAKINMNDTTS